MRLDDRPGVKSVWIFACLGLVACRPPGYGKGGDDDVDAAVAGDGATGDGAVDTPAAATCDKSFRLDGRSNASSVWLTGSFNDWAGDPPHGAVELVQGGDGAWTVTHTFELGTYQYKFIVNGNEWIADPTNPDQVDDGFGGKNSLYICAP